MTTRDTRGPAAPATSPPCRGGAPAAPRREQAPLNPPGTPGTPGLAELFKRLDAYDGAEPFGSRVAAELLGVQPRTVTGWATGRRLSGLLLARSRGYEFTITDLKVFLTTRYYSATNR